MSNDKKKKSLMPKFNLTNPFHLRTGRRKIIAGVLASATVFGGGSFLSYDYLSNSKDNVRATVLEKNEYISKICKKDVTRLNINYRTRVNKEECLENVRYTVVTDKGEFRNDPSIVFGKFSAKSLQDSIEIGTEYDFPITGKNANNFGALPNILKAEKFEPEVLEDDLLNLDNPEQSFEQNQFDGNQGQEFYPQQQQFSPQIQYPNNQNQNSQNFYNGGFNQDQNLNQSFNGVSGQNNQNYQINYNGRNVPNYPINPQNQGVTSPNNIRYPNIGNFNQEQNTQSPNNRGGYVIQQPRQPQ